MDGTGRDPASGPPSAGQFQSTRWSLVMAARGDSPEARAALGMLLEAYWYPLYAFVRRKGHGADEALDLVQGFLARLLERRDLASVHPSKGRLRSFLMASCSHYLANRHDYTRARKRGGGRKILSLNGRVAEGRFSREPSHELTPERLFDRRWATTLLDLALARLEAEMDAARKSRQFAALKPALSADSDRTPYDRIAADLGVTNEAARAAVHRLRRRYRELIRDEIALTVDDPSDVDDEIASLFAALGV